tara:strand:- start:196 stop:990 length:795 start_codon:yes stop_codon:yes gene_type:complete
VIIAIGLTDWSQFARVLRSATLVELNKEYVLAARVIDLPGWLIMTRHILPNVLRPVLVLATIGLVLTIIAEATLSFLGQGIPPTTPSLGTLIRVGNEFLFSGLWWIILFPAIALVVSEKFDWAGADLPLIVLSLTSVAGITAGTLYQKRFGGTLDWRTSATIQYVASAFVVAMAALVLEDLAVVWTGEFIFALTWLIVVLSLGAVALLYLLIRRGVVSKVASLFYLVPPTTAIMAYFLFGETLTSLALIGMVVAVTGVAMAVRN